MNTFPPLQEQLLWIAILTLLSFVALKVIRQKGLVKIPQAPLAFIALKDLIIVFSFYITLYFLVVPLTLRSMGPHLISHPIETISLLQVCFTTVVALLTWGYLKLKKIALITQPDSYSKALLKTLMYLAVIFPIASLIGQLCDTFLYLVFDVKGYEQLAVSFLKKTLDHPLPLTCSIISIIVLAPLTEELLFRGVLLNFFQTRFGSKLAVIISGICFALFHYSPSQGLGNISLLCALSFFGIMLGGFYLMTRSLFYPILLHAIFNTLSTLRIVFFD